MEIIIKSNATNGSLNEVGRKFDLTFERSALTSSPRLYKKAELGGEPTL
jgi:hypothetical protein